MPSFFQTLGKWFDRRTMRVACWMFFFVPFALYLFTGLDQLLERPPALDVGVVTVAAALGGLVLNAGLNLTGSKRKETVQVAQKFIAVVILMIIFLPALHFVELMNGINLNSFKPDSIEAWGRAFFFWVSAISFYVGISLFIIALVDLVYAMIGIDRIEHATGGDHGTPVKNGPCDTGHTGSNSSAQDLANVDVLTANDNGKE